MSIAEKIKEMDTKKKIKLGVIVIIVIILLWEIIGMLSSKSTSTVNVSTQPAVQVQKPVIVTQVKQKQFVPIKITASEVIDKNQTKYIETLNELQLLKVTQEIENTKQQIAAAQLATLQSEKTIKTLAHPEEEKKPLPVSAYANTLVNPSSNTSDNSASAFDPHYKLLYVANESGEWQVIIGSDGKLYNASLNTTLPDGSIVVDVSNTAVILSKDGSKRTITLTPLI